MRPGSVGGDPSLLFIASDLPLFSLTRQCPIISYGQWFQSLVLSLSIHASRLSHLLPSNHQLLAGLCTERLCWRGGAPPSQCPQQLATASGAPCTSLARGLPALMNTLSTCAPDGRRVSLAISAGAVIKSCGVCPPFRVPRDHRLSLHPQPPELKCAAAPGNGSGSSGRRRPTP